MQARHGAGDPRGTIPPGFFVDDDTSGRQLGKGGTLGCVAVLLLLSMLLGGGALVLLLSAKAPVRARPQPASAIETRQPEASTQSPLAIEALPIASADNLSPLPAAAEEPRTTDLNVVWKAKVTSGNGIPVGTACELAVSAVSLDGRLKSALPRLTCKGRVLYDGSHSNPTSLSRTLSEVAGDTDTTYRYRVKLDEQTEAEDTEIHLDSTSGEGRVSSTLAPEYDVKLELDELSSEHTGPALYTSSEGPRPCRRALRRNGVVTKVVGASPVAPGMACQLTVVPSLQQSSGDCYARTRVRCGKTILYGAGTGGFGPCTAADGAIATFLDDEGSPDDKDPMATLDVATRWLEVRDERSVNDDGTQQTSTHTVEIRLDPAPASVPSASR